MAKEKDAERRRLSTPTTPPQRRRRRLDRATPLVSQFTIGLGDKANARKIATTDVLNTLAGARE